MTVFFILNSVFGVIDSGSGGVNVIKNCLKLFCDDYVFLVDNKNCPYGNKRIQQIRDITKKNIKFLTDNFDLDFIIIACNTASSTIVAEELQNFGVPVLKTIPYVKEDKANNTLIFATKNTIKFCRQLKYYQKEYAIKFVSIKNFAKDIDEYIKTPKNNRIDKILIRKFGKAGKVKKKYKDVQCVSLGCTHFKHVKNNISNIFGNNISFCECETNVAQNAFFLSRKQKSLFNANIILTKEDEALRQQIMQLLYN